MACFRFVASTVSREKGEEVRGGGTSAKWPVKEGKNNNHERSMFFTVASSFLKEPSTKLMEIQVAGIVI